MRRSIVFTGVRQLQLIEEPIPRPDAGQLLVQTTRTLISTGTESIVFTRNFAPGTHWDDWVKYPFRTGYLHVGRVIEVGAGVGGWKVGDRVASRSTHSSHATVPVKDAVRIPDAVSDEDAAWMGLGKITQVGVRAARLVMGDDVVVIGLGLLGQLVAQYARLMGTQRVIAIDTAARRLEMAMAHGATHALNMTAADALPEVERITDGRRADVVFEVTGHPAVFAPALALPRRFGTLILLGDAGSPQLQTLTSDVIARGIHIIGTHDGHTPETPSDRDPWSGRRMHELFLTYVERGQIRLNGLVTHRYRPDDAAEAYEMLQRERLTAMGVLFDWTK